MDDLWRLLFLRESRRPDWSIARVKCFVCLGAVLSSFCVEPCTSPNFWRNFSIRSGELTLSSGSQESWAAPYPFHLIKNSRPPFFFECTSIIRSTSHSFSGSAFTSFVAFDFLAGVDFLLELGRFLPLLTLF